MKGILAAGIAPYVITTPGLLMPVRRQIWVPPPLPWGWPQINSYLAHAAVLAKQEVSYFDLSIISGPYIANGRFFDCGGVFI